MRPTRTRMKEENQSQTTPPSAGAKGKHTRLTLAYVFLIIFGSVISFVGLLALSVRYELHIFLAAGIALVAGVLVPLFIATRASFALHHRGISTVTRRLLTLSLCYLFFTTSVLASHFWGGVSFNDMIDASCMLAMDCRVGRQLSSSLCDGVIESPSIENDTTSPTTQTAIDPEIPASPRGEASSDQSDGNDSKSNSNVLLENFDTLPTKRARQIYDEATRGMKLVEEFSPEAKTRLVQVQEKGPEFTIPDPKELVESFHCPDGSKQVTSRGFNDSATACVAVGGPTVGQKRGPVMEYCYGQLCRYGEWEDDRTVHGIYATYFGEFSDIAYLHHGSPRGRWVHKRPHGFEEVHFNDRGRPVSYAHFFFLDSAGEWRIYEEGRFDYVDGYIISTYCSMTPQEDVPAMYQHTIVVGVDASGIWRWDGKWATPTMHYKSISGRTDGTVIPRHTEKHRVEREQQICMEETTWREGETPTTELDCWRRRP